MEQNKTEGTRPQFNVKVKGTEQGVYAGSAWLNKNNNGPYLTLKLDAAIPVGSTVYVSPRKDVEVHIGLDDKRPPKQPTFELNQNTQRYQQEQQRKEDAKAFI